MEAKHFEYDYPPSKVEVLVIAESKPISGSYFYILNEGNRSFFNGIMKAFGFYKKSISEEEMLNNFLNTGFFLIDASPEPINKLKFKERIEIILSYKDSLLKTIANFNPSIILFICKTNEKIGLELADNIYFGKRIIKNGDYYSFPYPGNGWLERKDGNGLINLLPEELKSPKN